MVAAYGGTGGRRVHRFGWGYNGVFLLCATASIIAMLVYLYMYLKLKKRIPALADAS